MPEQDFSLLRSELRDLVVNHSGLRECFGDPLGRADAILALRRAISHAVDILDEFDASLFTELERTGLVAKVCARCGETFAVPRVGRRPSYCQAHRRHRVPRRVAA